MSCDVHAPISLLAALAARPIPLEHNLYGRKKKMPPRLIRQPGGTYADPAGGTKIARIPNVFNPMDRCEAYVLTCRDIQIPFAVDISPTKSDGHVSVFKLGIRNFGTRSPVCTATGLSPVTFESDEQRDAAALEAVEAVLTMWTPWPLNKQRESYSVVEWRGRIYRAEEFGFT